MGRAQFLKEIQNQPHRLIPFCVIIQSSGKQRFIDNADTGGQSNKSSDANKLWPDGPAEVIGGFFQTDAWETGQEDLPSAYRFCPMSKAESMCCVVVWHHQEWNEPAYQLYSGLLLPLAVTSFNRLSRLLESLCRHLGGVLISFYFDDATITGPKSAKGSGQWAANEICRLVGSPFVT